jgi:dihydroorotate dehydrogenase electron transfer subunit
MAVSDFVTNKQYSFIYEIIGDGTKVLSTLKPKYDLDILENLGNSYEYKKEFGKPVLISGGSGLGPILCLAKFLNDQKTSYDLICGFPNKNKVTIPNEIKKLNSRAYICTDDGSYGEKGNVISIINKYNLDNNYYYACGSINMLKAIYKNNKIGQLSLDERMGCGFGACMGCAIKTKTGTKRICKNGPIFKSGDLLW